jgi:hypothetical protein
MACLLCACEGGGAGDAGVPFDGPAALARPALCDRAGDDPIRDVFCAAEPPAISGFEDVMRLFDLHPDDYDPLSSRTLDPTLHITALGHSTALPAHVVSPLNPRLIILGGKAIVAFQRGVQRIELSTVTRGTGRFVFYLLSFEQACNQQFAGCGAGALYTAAIERDWQRITLEDDEDLKNTPADCRQCHQRAVEEPRLLMRELESPWTHFFFDVKSEDTFPGENGSGLMRDYVAAKGDERYGGVDMSLINANAAFTLQRIVGNQQPVLFDAPRIESERWPFKVGEGYSKTVQASPTWESGYEAFKRGEQLALPYIELRATDPDKQAALGSAYRRYLDGYLDAGALPDMSDIFPDDPRLRARIGLATEPDATPAEALIQACGACHNDVLDQSISRARFNIAIGRLSREEIELAIERIERPTSMPGAMPPPEARQLAPQARTRLLEYLRSDFDPAAVDPMLEHAAKQGMTGGAKVTQ